MRVLHVVENLNTGGLENVVISLVKKQSYKNNDCKVLCIFEPGVMADKLQSRGIEVLSANKSNGLDFKLIKYMRSVFKEFKPDVIHTHNPVSHYYTCLSALFTPFVNIINTRHGMGLNPVSKKREFLYGLTQFNTKLYVAVAEFAFDSFIERGIFKRSNSCFIHNGIDSELVPKKNQDAKFRFLESYEVEFDSETIVLGMVSRLDKVKDHKTLLNAFKVASTQYTNMYLFIIGEGSERVYIESLIGDLNLTNSVFLLGEKKDAYLYLENFDVYVLSTHSEGYSMTLLEACAAGLPIISTDVGGNAEIVKHNKNGFLVAHMNEADLAKRILQLANDNDLLNEFSKNSFEWSRLSADISITEESYKNIYES